MRVLVALPHALLREGLSHVLHDVAPAAEILLSEKAALSRVAAPDTGPLTAAIVAYPWVSLATLRGLRTREPTAVLIVVTRNADAATQRRLLDNDIAAIVPESATPDVVAAALRVALCGDVNVQSAALRRHRDTPPVAASRRRRTTDLNLTPRQFDVLHLVAGGCANREIAAELGIGLRTVKGHVAVLLRALHADNRREAGRHARRWLAGSKAAIGDAAQRESRYRSLQDETPIR